MAELVRLARMPYPLPVGALRNRRSLLSLDNLVAAIDARAVDACAAPAAADRVRPGGANHSGDGRRRAAGPRPPTRTRSGTGGDAENRIAGPGPRRGIRPPPG